MKMTILTLGAPNLNGRTYTKEAVEKALLQYKAKGKPLLVTDCLLDGPEVNLERVVGQVINNEVTNTKWTATVQMLETAAAQKFAAMNLEDFSVRPSFIGNVSDDGVVSNLVLNFVCFTNDPA
jgi:phospholipase/lecithinase/hemolysin